MSNLRHIVGSAKRVGASVGLAVVLTPMLLLCAQDSSTRRARPPRWDDVPAGVFFQDAFREGLRGPRPASLPEPAHSTPQVDPNTAAGPDVERPAFRWSGLIAAATLEDELKAIKLQTDQALQNEGYFKQQGYRELRADLGTAAVVFAIIDLFDGSVRWHTEAATMRDRFARVARNSKAGSSQVFREAKLRQQELGDLIRGAELTAATANSLRWPDVADRQLIMQRLEVGVQNTMATALGSTSEFQRQRATLVHESELAAALARPDATRNARCGRCGIRRAM